MSEEVMDDILEEEDEEERPLSWTDALRRIKLPIIVWVVFTTTFFACAFGGAGFLMYSVAGYAWIMCFAFSVMVIPTKLDGVAFPISVWLPWVLFVVLSGYMSDYINMQRSALLLCPIVVGIAASTAKIDEDQLLNFGLLMRVFSASLLLLSAFLTGLLITGELPSSTGLAPQAITATLLGTFFVAGYSSGRVKDLLWWGGIAMMPGPRSDPHGNFRDRVDSAAHFFTLKIPDAGYFNCSCCFARSRIVLHSARAGKNVHER